MSALDLSFQKLLQSQSLTLEESYNAMKEIMSGDVSDIKLSAWLTALRLKGESANEIAGCAKLMKEYASEIKCNDKNAIDVVGTGGDGAHTINISTTSAIVAAGAGITVAKHGNKAVSSKSGSADVLSSLGIKIDVTPEKMEETLNEIGISFLFAPKLHPAMKYAMPVRKELGMRSIFNILGPLTNPAKVKRGVLGVYDKALCPVIAKALVELDCEHFLVVHGNDGLDEITISDNTFVCEVRNGEIKEYELNPEDFGIKKVSITEVRGGEPAENAEIIKNILSGKETGPMLDIVLLNSAAAIYISGKVSSWNDAMKMAKETISSGNAMNKLNELVAATN